MQQLFVAQDCADRSVGDDAAAVDDDGAVTQLMGVGQVVRRQHDRLRQRLQERNLFRSPYASILSMRAARRFLHA